MLRSELGEHDDAAGGVKLYRLCIQEHGNALNYCYWPQCCDQPTYLSLDRTTQIAHVIHYRIHHLLLNRVHAS